MSFVSLGKADYDLITQKIDSLTKSLAGGYHGLEAAGRTGVAALAKESLEPVMESIALEETDFILLKGVKSENMKALTYSYMLKTANSSNSSLLSYWGTETSIGQEDAPAYQRVAEVAKPFNKKTSVTLIHQELNNLGGFHIDTVADWDKSATIDLMRAIEYTMYNGGDLFMNASGFIDYNAVANPNSQKLLEMRGIQASVREGNRSTRGINGDMVGFGSNRPTVFNRKGAPLERTFLDHAMTAVIDNGHAISEGHCTPSQLTQFRASFFPIERANLGEVYQIRGPAVNNDSPRGFTVDTIGGPLTFVPTRMKYLQQALIVTSSSAQAAPNTPSVSSALTSGAVNSGFTAGQVLFYRVQAVGITGAAGYASASASITVTTSNYGVELTITNVTNAAYYKVYRTDVGTAEAGKEMFCGRIEAAEGATTVFRDVNRVIPGLSAVLFMPKDQSRVKLGKIGSMINKVELGRTGMATETLYWGALACIVTRPRSMALIDNVSEDRALLDSFED